MEKLSWSGLLAKFETSVHKSIAEARRLPGTTGIVVLECHVLDSSRIGHLTAMTYGPDRTYKTLADIEANKAGIYVTGLPSSAAFPIAYTEDLPQ